MSVIIMGQVWRADLPHNEQFILLALADHARDDGTKVFPSIAHTAWKCGYSPRNVRRIVGRLEHAGILEPVAFTKGGRGHATEYRIWADKIPLKQPFAGVMDDIASALPENDVKADKLTRKGGHPVTKADNVSLKADTGVRPTIRKRQIETLEKHQDTPSTSIENPQLRRAERRELWATVRRELGRHMTPARLRHFDGAHLYARDDSGAYALYLPSANAARQAEMYDSRIALAIQITTGQPAQVAILAGDGATSAPTEVAAI